MICNNRTAQNDCVTYRNLEGYHIKSAMATTVTITFMRLLRTATPRDVGLGIIEIPLLCDLDTFQ
jgi:hypothetical protein